MELDLVDDETTGPFVRYLGLQITERTGDRVEARWTAGEKHHQPFGIVHGGVHASVVETLGSIGAAAWFGDRGQVVGVSNTTDFFRAVREGEMVSVATPVHQGRSQQVWDVVTRDAEDRLVARGQLRVQNLTR
jgi:uncharacterized protein (TIGR00369 family)